MDSTEKEDGDLDERSGSEGPEVEKPVLDVIVGGGGEMTSLLLLFGLKGGVYTSGEGVEATENVVSKC